jgi:DNA (cytosine-5)-methyltransferase 1
MLKFGSVCSGIEAASVAWEPLGWKAAWLSEIEPFPSAVLKHHYPDVPNLGDMTTLPERILSGEVEAPDLFCGGTPCQAFSVAGLRKSLGDARGNLSLTFCEIANAIDDIRSVRGLPASIVFWENVPGVLSTIDNAFGCFLAALVGGDEPLNAPDGWPNAGCVDGPQRSAAWRVLDAQYFGVAQRRRRVFVVASARDGFDPAAILFEWGGVRRDTAPSRKTGQAVAGTFKACASSGGWSNSADHAAAGYMQPYPATVTTHRMVAFGEYKDDGTASAMKARDYKDATDLVAQPIALQDVTPREKAQNGRGWNDDGTAYTVDTHATQGVMQPIPIDTMNHLGRSDNHSMGDFVPGAPSFTLTKGHSHAVAQPIAFHPTQDPISSTDGTSHAMGCGSSSGQASVAIAFQPIADCLTAAYGTKWNGNASATNGSLFAAQPIAFEENFHAIKEVQVAPAMTTEGYKVSQNAGGLGLRHAMQVRRLTPVECERLQGFPDGYTDIKLKGKATPDGPRYKALGNSWAVPVVAWIGRRIQENIRVST